MTAWFELEFQADWAGDANVALVHGAGDVAASGTKDTSGSSLVSGSGYVAVQTESSNVPVEPPQEPPSWGGFTTIGIDEIKPAHPPRRRKKQIELVFPGTFTVVKTTEKKVAAEARVVRSLGAEFSAELAISREHEWVFAADYEASDLLLRELRDEEDLIALMVMGELD